MIQGSGSYVYDDRDVFNSERRRIAMQLEENDRATNTRLRKVKDLVLSRR